MGYFEKTERFWFLDQHYHVQTPSRWDTPGGSLPELISSLETIIDLEPRSVVPARGPTIKGSERISQVLNQHLAFLEECLENDGTYQGVGLVPQELHIS